jgi:RNA polymerase sigma-70 factor, ECF subfamily
VTVLVLFVDRIVESHRSTKVHAAVAVVPGEADAGKILRRDQAFRSAITPLVDVAFRVLRRLGVHDREIDDALQTVLVIADRRFDDLPTQQDLKAYVCAACVNVARDVGRNRARQSARNADVEALERAASAAPDPEEALGRKQALELVQRILETMDEERRAVFVLYELEELTGDEIAEHLGIPVGTVASRLRKARDEFRSAIARVRASQRSLVRGGR